MKSIYFLLSLLSAISPVSAQDVRNERQSLQLTCGAAPVCEQPAQCKLTDLKMEKDERDCTRGILLFKFQSSECIAERDKWNGQIESDRLIFSERYKTCLLDVEQVRLNCQTRMSNWSLCTSGARAQTDPTDPLRTYTPPEKSVVAEQFSRGRAELQRLANKLSAAVPESHGSNVDVVGINNPMALAGLLVSSQHLSGQAAYFTISGMDAADLGCWLVNRKSFDFDQLILVSPTDEKGKARLSVSDVGSSRNRRQVLSVNGDTVLNGIRCAKTPQARK